MIVVAGASGFVGQRLCARLEAQGRPVRRGSRQPGGRAGWVALDVDRPETLRTALAGGEVLVYLVHGMRGAHGAALLDQERAAAEQVRRAAEQAGLRRIVYLGGPQPVGVPSEHLAARLATGQVLRAGEVSCIELRAAMIVGHGSESWTMTRDLAFRLPIMLLPRWLQTRSQPIGVDDVVDALSAAIDDPLPGSEAFDLPGPEVLTARQILERIAAFRQMRPVMVPVPVLTPSLSAHWLRLVTRADYRIARQLVDGLASDLLGSAPSYWDHLGRRPLPFDEVARRALAEEGEAVRGAGRIWESLARRAARRAAALPRG